MRKQAMLLLCICCLTGCMPAAGQQDNHTVIFNTITENDVIDTLPHENAFTEGFFFDDGILYESSGLTGKSFIYRYKDNCRVPYNDVFLEGSTIMNGKLYVLTYKDNKAYVLDKDSFKTTKEYDYSREGWGLTTDGAFLITSDGTDAIHYMDDAYNDIKTIHVTLNGEPVPEINELEYIDGYILANIWRTKKIIAIDPETGRVVKETEIDLQTKNKDSDVLNGIAYDGKDIYITGKWYDEIWKVKKESLLP